MTREERIRDGIASGADWQRRLQSLLRRHPYPADLREAVGVALDAVIPAGDREQRIAERIKALMDAIVSVELHPINLDPYPASVGEVADEIARYVLELEASGLARGLAGMVRERLERGEAADEDGRATMQPVDNPAEFH